MYCYYILKLPNRNISISLKNQPLLWDVNTLYYDNQRLNYKWGLLFWRTKSSVWISLSCLNSCALHHESSIWVPGAEPRQDGCSGHNENRSWLCVSLDFFSDCNGSPPTTTSPAPACLCTPTMNWFTIYNYLCFSVIYKQEHSNKRGIKLGLFSHSKNKNDTISVCQRNHTKDCSAGNFSSTYLFSNWERIHISPLINPYFRETDKSLILFFFFFLQLHKTFFVGV